jgi:hypothetical protein
MQFRPAARSHRQKAAILARFKGNNTPRAPFFSACVRMALVLVNSISTRKKTQVFGPPSAICKRQTSNSRENVGHSTPSPDLFRAICSWGVPSSKHCGCGPVWRQVQLTTHSRHWAVGSVVSSAAVASPSTNYYQLRSNCQLPAASYQQQPTTRPAQEQQEAGRGPLSLLAGC